MPERRRTAPRAAREGFLPIAAMLVVVMTVLFLLFIPVLRRITAHVRAQMRTIQHQALRWTFLGSGMTHENFLTTLERLSPAAYEQIIQVAPAFC